LNTEIPKTQTAVQLIGPDELKVNENKDVFAPGAYQILAEVEAVGLCFSDLKLLKQFSSHVRKSEIVSGVDKSILKEIPSYAPGDAHVVPGHEAVVRVIAIGDKVTDAKLGGRYLVQTDYRWLPTANSNAAFGYNFEGALQQYVLMDQRVITSDDGESMLIPASEQISASAIALVEPWACVEDAYVVKERTTLKENGQMLVVAEDEFDEKVFMGFVARFGKPAKITLVSKASKLESIEIPVDIADNVESLADASFDDVIYFGSCPETVESLFAKVAINGFFNIALCGGKFGRDVSSQVGRVHYGNIRIIGTTGSDPSTAMEYVPATAEIRTNDKIDVVGAAGPMGVMHVVRNLCQGVKGVKVYGGDLDDERLAALSKIADPAAKKNGVEFIPYNPSKGQTDEKFDYVVVMAPVGKLVAASVGKAAQKGIINIFAGIPATVNADIDLDMYIEKQLYFIGTSGSTLDDMKTVLKKVENGSLDTNISVGAICGLENAIEGIRAVESHSIAGKIIVYPSCDNLDLIELEGMKAAMPDVSGCLNDGLWNKEAEDTLLKSKGA